MSFLKELWNRYMTTNAQYMSSSDVSDSESEETSCNRNDTNTISDTNDNTPVTQPVPIIQGDEETDAAVRIPISLPSAQSVLTLEKLYEIESELDDLEIVSLLFLLSDEEDVHWCIQQLMLMEKGGSKKILSKWVTNKFGRGENWQNKMVEALCVIKNYYVLNGLGFEKRHVIDHFLPKHVHSIHINQLRKCCYLICDNLDSNDTKRFLENLNDSFKRRRIAFEEIESGFLEIHFLNWERRGILDMQEVRSILKLMSEERLYNLVDVLLRPLENSTPSMATIEDRSLANSSIENSSSHSREMSFEIPNNSESLIHAMGATALNRSRKPSSCTSVDNYNIRSEGNDKKIVENESSVKKKCYIKEEIDDNDVYPVDPQNPGVVLIINQEFFYRDIDPLYKNLLPPDIQGNLAERLGSSMDKDRLEEVFKKFGFRVETLENLTHLELIKEIKRVTKSITKESSLIICIMSHGDKGTVYGSNSCRVKVSEIQEIMDCYNKKNLKGKPKILILQSCQGLECQILETEEDLDEDRVNITTDGPSSGYRDMYIFWSTIKGYASIRNKKTGSWFIQAFCEELDNYGDSEHFQDICTKVKKRVTGQTWKKNDMMKIGMTPIDHSTLVHKFYFPKRVH
ncbi:unnamed protein product [Phyllotreta striolata]|uniref:Caspase-8 n=1 Tax=Phyllotreta striolata TaxID=444603 RepID=A0A9N9TIU2_PHYSR|nr:unnamed protein product [Phyllotreta striolata]